MNHLCIVDLKKKFAQEEERKVTAPVFLFLFDCLKANPKYRILPFPLQASSSAFSKYVWIILKEANSF